MHRTILTHDKHRSLFTVNVRTFVISLVTLATMEGGTMRKKARANVVR